MERMIADDAPRPPAGEIRMLPAGAATDTALVTGLTELINQVYATAEYGLWQGGATRTTAAELAGLIRAGQIAVAEAGGRIVGGVRVQRLGDAVGEFGMLVTRPGHRRAGLGRRLVAFAEERSRERGLATMRLELLVPRTWTHPTKKRLQGWYERLGYRVARTGALDEQYPELAPLLATPCDYLIYHKALGAPGA